MKIPSILTAISKRLQTNNAKTIIVGGSVRDHFLGVKSKDYDVEVYALKSLDELIKILQEYGSVNLVGKSFGVLKFNYNGDEYDFSFPRLESKIALGHRGFDVSIDGNLDFKTASKRRDFTMNAMGYDIVKKEFLDPFNGLVDIEKKQLKHVDSNSFTDDPLRVYRAVQFSSRFNYKLADETFTLCKQMVSSGMLDELAKERVYEEFKKLLLKSKKPSIGFNLMLKLGIIEKYFPELYAIVNIPQSIKWHPEGDVWTHTMLAIDMMAEELRAIDEKNEKFALKLFFATLCHDFGKATHTTHEEDGRIRSIGHEKAGVKPTKNFMFRLTCEKNFIDSILPLVEQHMKPSQFYASNAKSAAIRRLATKVNIEELTLVAKADFLGRTTEESLSGVYRAGDWLISKSKELNVNQKALKCLLQGRDLIELGLEPSPKFKEILAYIYKEQLDGIVTNKKDAINLVNKFYI